MIIYLYKKTHRITGLMYLGKTTSKDPYAYSGSGKYWKAHLNKHGFDYDTEILKECSTPDEVKHWGEYYSELWDVVTSDEWANLKAESGDGGDPGPIGRKRYQKHRLEENIPMKKILTKVRDKLEPNDHLSILLKKWD